MENISVHTQPRVSVLIAAFDAHATIGEAVRSLTAQSFPHWEAIVVSDDGTDYVETLTRQGLNDVRLRQISSGGFGRGPAAARNAGLAAAEGRFVTRLDADDRYRPDRLASLLPLAEAHGAAIDNVVVVRDADAEILGYAVPPGLGVAALDAAALLALSVPVAPLVRRDLAAPWDEDLRLCDDVLFALRVLERTGAIAFAPAPLYEYRVRVGSVCHSEDSAERAERDYATVQRRLQEDGYGFSDPGLRDRLLRAVRAKASLNQAFQAARFAGDPRTFQEFVASERADGVR